MVSSDQIALDLYDLHAGQQRIVREAKRFNVLMCGRRFGKSVLLGDLAIDTLLDGQPVGYFGADYKTLMEWWRETCMILAPVTVRRNDSEHRLEIMGGGVLEAWTLNNEDAGRSRKYKRVLIDEAGLVDGLEATWQNAIRPTLLDLKGDAWFAGTPKRYNFFAILFEKAEAGTPGWACWRMATHDNPGIAPDEIDALKEGLPKSVVDQEIYALVHNADHPDQVIPTEWIRAAQERWKEALPRTQEGIIPISCIGVDPAMGGGDRTAIAVRRDYWIAPVETYPGSVTTKGQQTAQLVVKAMGDERPPVWVDITGVGHSPANFLEAWGVDVRGFQGSERSPRVSFRGNRFYNKRAWSWFYLRWCLNPDSGIRIDLPPGYGLLQELASAWFEMTPNGIRIAKKDKIKKVLGRSPDEAEAVILSILPT